jgi:hypothetical protein
MARGAEAPLEGYRDEATWDQAIEEFRGRSHVWVRELCRTPGERPVHLITIGLGEADEVALRPSLLIVGGVHGPDLVSAEAALRVAERLQRLAAEGEGEAHRLLQQRTVLIVPRANPDAQAAFFARPYRARLGNDRRVDDDRDGTYDEDPLVDLDGDGYFTGIRVEEPSGTFVPHPEDPRVLVEADKARGEKGRFTLHPEGNDRDEDGAIGEDAPGGVAFDKNFTFRYPFFEVGAGPHQVSEPETRALADLVLQTDSLVCVLTLSPQDNLREPWKPDNKREKQRIKEVVLKADVPYLDAVAKAHRERLGERAKGAPKRPAAKGTFVEWVYFHAGRPSFGSRAFFPPAVQDGKKDDEKKQADDEKDDEKKQADEEKKLADEEKQDDDKKKDEDKRGEATRDLLAYFEREGVEGFAPWTEIEHEAFPGRRVWVGGVRPFFALNPKGELLGAIARDHEELALDLIGRFPDVSLAEAKVEPLGDELFRLTVIVRNDGFLPTVTAMGQLSRRMRSVMLELGLPESARLVTGTPRAHLPPIAGSGASLERAFMIALPKDAPNRRVVIEVGSPHTGSDRHVVELSR